MEGKKKKSKKVSDEFRESAAITKARQRAQKLLATAEKKSLNQEEVLKRLKVVIDCNLKSKNVTTVLDDNAVNYVFENSVIPCSVTWRQTVENYFVTESYTIDATQEIHEGNQILVVWDSKDVVDKIMDSFFVESVGSLSSIFPEKKLTLVVYGNPLTGKKVSRIKLEENLAEIQIKFNCTSRLIENSEDLALMIYQFSKAISSLPSAAHKNDNLQDMDSYIYGDNKDSVKVDKDGYGLNKLWEKQLSQFTLSTTEVAQAIAFVYKSPAELIKAYQECSQVEGENLLKDIPLRREASAVASKRKLGREMSKKIYVMFTSEDGNQILKS